MSNQYDISAKLGPLWTLPGAGGVSFSASDRLKDAVEFYMAICGNTAASVTPESASEAYDLGKAALAEAASTQTPEIPMYSFERPAYILWNGIYNGLRNRGWTDEEAREWLRSKHTRWLLDDVSGELLDMLGKFAAKSAEKVT